MSEKPTYEELEQRVKQFEQAELNFKKSEEALRDSEERYRALFENMGVGVAIYEVKGDAEDFIFTDFNKAAEKIDNQKKEALVGRSVFEARSGVEEFGLIDVFREVWKTGKPKHHPISLYHDDKLKKWYNNFVYKLPADEIVAIFSDDTERKQIEEALRQSEERFALFMNHMPGIAFIKDGEGKYVYANELMCTLVNKSLEDVLGATNEDLFSTETAAQISRNDAQMLSQGIPITVEESGIVNGKQVYYITVKFPFPMPDGSMSGVAGVGVDISEIQGAREEKTALQEQLRQAQKMETLGTLAGGIAHDFNNILFPIVGYTEMSMDLVEPDSTLQKNMAEVLKATRRADSLVKQILAFSRQTEQERKPVQVKLILKEVLKFLRASLPSTITVRQDILSESTVLADPTELHQILMNLCTNAYHAMRDEGGILDVSLSEIQVEADDVIENLDLQPGPYIKLKISDTGCGMSKAVMERIFAPYFTTKDQAEGTGLGLAVVLGIIKSLTGNITVESEVGKGTTFTIHIPRIEDSTDISEVLTAQLVPTGSEHVLFVDDETQVCKMVQQMLEKLGYQITACTNSLEALEEFNARPQDFDLLITDMTMPALTGLELARQAMSVRPDIPVILCTGFSELITERKAKAVGVRECVMKPILRKDIAETIRKVLDQSGTD